MDPILNPFQQRHDLFKRFALPLLGQRHDGKISNLQLQRDLVLADRALAAAAGDPEFGVLHDSLPRLLDKAAGVDLNTISDGLLLSQLLTVIEPWYKWVLKLVRPDQYEIRKAGDQRLLEEMFSLFNTILDLELLTQKESKFGSKQQHRIKCPVRRAVLDVRLARNDAVHRSEQQAPVRAVEVFTHALVALLAPVARSRIALARAVEGLVVRPLECDDAAEVLLGGVGAERAQHLREFTGRKTELRDLIAEIERTQESGGYLLVSGPQGMGKSALMAALTAELSERTAPMGSPADAVRESTPWLPGALCFHGKQSADPMEIVQCLSIQANTMLFDPCPTAVAAPPERRKPREFERSMPSIAESVSDAEPQSSQKRNPASHGFGFLVTRLAAERGRAVIIIDALDEIAQSVSTLAFLPSALPPGVCVVLTSRDRSDIHEWLAVERRSTVIELRGLQREDIPHLTRVRDVGASEIEFNDRVHSQSAGWPLLAVAVRRQAGQDGTNLSSIAVENSVAAVLAQQAAAWSEPGRGKEGDIRQACLVLLAVFNEIGHLSPSALAEWSSHCGHDATANDVKQALVGVSEQLQYRGDGSCKLSLQVFAEYAVTSYFGVKEFHGLQVKVIQWIHDEKRYWRWSAPLLFRTEVHRVKNRLSREPLAGFFKECTSRGSDSYLRDVDSAVKEMIYDTSLPIEERRMLGAIHLDCATSLFELGVTLPLREVAELMAGDDDVRIVERGLGYLKSIAELGDVEALASLVDALIENERFDEAMKFVGELVERDRLNGLAHTVRVLMSFLETAVSDDEEDVAERSGALLAKAVDALAEAWRASEHIDARQSGWIVRLLGLYYWNHAPGDVQAVRGVAREFMLTAMKSSDAYNRFWAAAWLMVHASEIEMHVEAMRVAYESFLEEPERAFLPYLDHVALHIWLFDDDDRRRQWAVAMFRDHADEVEFARMYATVATCGMSNLDFATAVATLSNAVTKGELDTYFLYELTYISEAHSYFDKSTVECLETARLAGDEFATLALGRIYGGGLGVPADLEVPNEVKAEIEERATALTEAEKGVRDSTGLRNLMKYRLEIERAHVETSGRFLAALHERWDRIASKHEFSSLDDVVFAHAMIFASDGRHLDCLRGLTADVLSATTRSSERSWVGVAGLIGVVSAEALWDMMREGELAMGAFIQEFLSFQDRTIAGIDSAIVAHGKFIANTLMDDEFAHIDFIAYSFGGPAACIGCAVDAPVFGQVIEFFGLDGGGSPNKVKRRSAWVRSAAPVIAYPASPWHEYAVSSLRESIAETGLDDSPVSRREIAIHDKHCPCGVKLLDHPFGNSESDNDDRGHHEQILSLYSCGSDAMPEFDGDVDSLSVSNAAYLADFQFLTGPTVEERFEACERLRLLSRLSRFPMARALLGDLIVRGLVPGEDAEVGWMELRTATVAGDPISVRILRDALRRHGRTEELEWAEYLCERHGLHVLDLRILEAREQLISRIAPGGASCAE